MDLRAKILSAVFALAVMYVLVTSVVYPRWIEPLVSIDERIAEKQERYDELKAVEDDVARATKKYVALVARVGSFEIERVETELRDRLNKLIEKHGLQDASTAPSRPKRDQKTDVTYLTITVKGTGTLQAAVEFLRDVAELPHLARVTSPAIYPASRSRKDRGPTKMNIRVPVEILIPPPHRKVGVIKQEDLVQPELFVRHQGREYSSLWDGTPFTHEPDYKPLKVDAGKDVNLPRPKTRKISLNARTTGGDGLYTCKWEPKEGLTDANACRSKIDVSQPCDRTYVVIVADGQGKTATDTLRVVVREPPQEPEVVDTKPPRPVKVVDPRWKYRKNMQLVMVLGTRSGRDQISEAMINNKKAHQDEYYARGQEFDGGELVSLHPTGVLVRRKDGFFIYPIGGWLDEDISVVDPAADAYPQLKEAALRIRKVEDEKATQEAARKTAAEAEQKAAEAARQKTAAEATSDKTGQVGKKNAPGKPGTTKPSGGKQQDQTAGDANVPKAGKPPIGTQRPGSNRPAVRKTPRSGVGQGGGKQTPRPGQVKPSSTTMTKPETPTKRGAQRAGKRPKFKPRSLGPKPGQESETEEDKQSGSESGKEDKEKDNDKEKDKDKENENEKDKDEGKSESEGTEEE